jgi:excinuclease UvrABC ATPase subunit
MACRDCAGFGSLDPARHAEFHGVELQAVATLTFGEILQRIRAATAIKVAFGDLTERLRVVCESGLSDYPVGASIDLLSQGERALVSMVVGKLSKFSGISYVVDGAVFGGSTRDEIPGGIRGEIRVAVPPSELAEASFSKTESIESIVLRNVRYGPLRIDEIAFPVGAFSIVQGSVGVGKSLLLKTIAERFTKRRKNAHLTAFGSIKRCHALCEAVPHDGVVLELLGLSTQFAEEIARTKQAKRSGLLAQDLELRTSSYRCGECSGVGTTSAGTLCSQCEGALFDWRVSGLELGGVSVASVLQKSFCELKGMFWASDRLSYLIGQFPSQYTSQLRLSTPVAALAPEVRRFLRIWGHLIGVAARSHDSKRAVLKGDLVLVDGPGPLVASHLSEVSRVLRELIAAGATVIGAGLAESLESQCSSVVRLALSAGVDRAAHETLDTRYARVSGLSVC